MLQFQQQKNLNDYVRELCELFINGYALDPGKITLKFDLEDITTLIDIAIPLGLVLSELASNSLKHAFPEGTKGNVSIKLSELDEEFIDNGIGVPSNFDFLNQKTLGLETICILAEDQLQGNVKFKNDNGVSCTVKFKKYIYKERIQTKKENPSYEGSPLTFLVTIFFLYQMNHSE